LICPSFFYYDSRNYNQVSRMKACPKCGKQYPDEANFCPVDAGRLTMRIEAQSAAATVPDEGLIGGRFRLSDRIGGQATGQVFTAVDQEAGATVALKLVHPTVFPTPMLLQRSERELKQLEKVVSASIAQVIAHGRQGDQLWVATELLSGVRTLSEEVEAQGALDVGRATDIMVAVGKALAEAASAGVIHRDLSPKNVLITATGIKLINFSVPVPATERVQGAPEFVAPEVIEGKPVDQRSNIYSLGSLWYFALTAQPPHMGVDAASVHQAILNVAVVPPSQRAAVPADIDALVMKSLERNAAKRFMTLPLMISEVERAVAGPPGGTGSTAPFGRAGAAGGKAGKSKVAAQTVMGMGNLADPALKTRKMDVAIPPEAIGGPEPGAVSAIGGVAAAGPQQATQRVFDVPALSSSDASMTNPMAAAAGAPTLMPSSPPSPFAQNNAAAAPTLMPSSPFAPPQAGAAAAPAPAAPHVVPPGPITGGGASGKKKKDAPPTTKGKFRETMWFKKGDLDAAAAEMADEEKQRTGAEVADKADDLPMEERYKDDGSIDRGDVEKYSLKTGATQMMAAMRDPNDRAGSKVSEQDLIKEMKGGRTKYIIAGGVALVAVVVAIILMAK
jgi:hypothetical protein